MVNLIMVFIDYGKVNETYPMSSLFFSEANGGEFRQSFHGYPRNYAQLINVS